ncbi:hypothetical protein PoB_000428500 [Plakobranchus ocellatus]|uniref:Uncharacterized protein n=1 Tax=Plakobranchus ocellatus TaxID=259542 RepID=A0AAV3Y410_9GAST|nr:hypothetical protein PoB_000428500 [Plakobranchus ocellatus]
MHGYLSVKAESPRHGNALAPHLLKSYSWIKIAVLSLSTFLHLALFLCSGENPTKDSEGIEGHWLPYEDVWFWAIQMYSLQRECKKLQHCTTVRTHQVRRQTA